MSPPPCAAHPTGHCLPPACRGLLTALSLRACPVWQLPQVAGLDPVLLLLVSLTCTCRQAWGTIFGHSASLLQAICATEEGTRAVEHCDDFLVRLKALEHDLTNRAHKEAQLELLKRCVHTLTRRSALPCPLALPCSLTVLTSSLSVKRPGSPGSHC